MSYFRRSSESTDFRSVRYYFLSLIIVGGIMNSHFVIITSCDYGRFFQKLKMITFLQLGSSVRLAKLQLFRIETDCNENETNSYF